MNAVYDLFANDNTQGRSIIFPTKGVEDTNKFLLAKLHQYLGNFD